MNADKIINKLAEANQINVSEISRLSGGDINEVFLITSNTSEKFVVKINDADRFPGMFEAEKEGLSALAKPGVIDIPKVINTGETGKYSWLLLEYKASAPNAANFWETFGQQLAALHKTTSKEFGFPQNNYIGSLPQYNAHRETAADFYISQRLEPQLKMAKERGHDLGNTSGFFKNISDIIPDEVPALIHGDLWNGNYLVNIKGRPCLIDPAVAFAPREMDLAMMKLFGGFNQSLFETYHRNFPLKDGFEERVPLWQLYYLLVHLNLFGSGYKSSVLKILRHYS